MALNILVLSSSRTGESEYLATAIADIQKFIGIRKKIAFIPFASVDDHHEYLNKVQEGLSVLNLEFTLITGENAKKELENAEVIMTGGGNTFKLLHDLYTFDLMDLIIQKVQNGIYYIGWSAGSNICGPTICTTNDMPVIEPLSFTSFGFLPFQINPHYINQEVEGFHGETRDQRLSEFVKLNAGIPVIGLPEGSSLQLKNDAIYYKGDVNGIIFYSKKNNTSFVERREIESGSELTYMMSKLIFEL